MEYNLSSSSTSINASLDSLYIPRKRSDTNFSIAHVTILNAASKAQQRHHHHSLVRGTYSVTEKTQRTVDSGYAYVVLLSATVGFFLVTALVGCNALVYQQLLDRFKLSATATGWMVGLQSAVRMLSSPIVRLLYAHCYYRTVAIAGGFCFTLGIVWTAYASEPWMVYVGFSVFAGVGSNMFLMSSFIMLTEYFDARRGKAMGISYTGCGVGGIVFPPIINACFVNYGYTQTLMILSGIVAQLCVSGALFRPQPPLTIEIDSVVDIATDKTDKADKLSKTKLLKRSNDLQLLTNGRYLTYTLTMTSLFGLNYTGNIFMASMAHEAACLSSQQITALLSMGSLGQMVSQVVVGLVFDVSALRRYRPLLYSLLSAAFGVSCTALAFCTDFVSFAVLWTLFQVISLGAHCQHITVLGDVLPPQRLQCGIAVCRTVMGVGVFLISTVFGTFADLTGSQKQAFIYLGTFHTLLTGVCTFCYVCLNQRRRTSKKQQKMSGKKEELKSLKTIDDMDYLLV